VSQDWRGTPETLSKRGATAAGLIECRVRADRSPLYRWGAAFEVLAVSGIPTQAAIALVLIVGFDMPYLTEDGFSLPFFATLSLLDTAVIVTLIRVFLRLSRERPADVFLGPRPMRGEVVRGLLFVPLVFVGVSGLVLTLRTLAPWMHTVEDNPLEAFLTSPGSAALFLVVVILAGGVREELQRAFILHRFEQHLGGIRLGLVLFSLAFGALHLDQGIDVAIAIGTLGLVWGLVFIRRRSAVLPMVNHAGFNALQVVQSLMVRSLGV
jgi:membrane protease YdiL (CAAX protease family)